MKPTPSKDSKPREYWHVPIEHIAMMDKTEFSTYEEAQDAVAYIVGCGRLPYGGATKIFDLQDIDA